MQANMFTTRKIEEGGTSLVVPTNALPKRSPFFFNPKGELVRDVSIACYKAYSESCQKSGLTFGDPLTGVGARAIRVAKEVEACSKVFLNDMNSRALTLAKQSALLNRVESKCVFSKEEACSFLVSRLQNEGERFDIVDIDPFGTPSPFVDCGIRAVRHNGLLSITATDSAVLCGVYPEVAQRKYLGASLRTDYSHEVGIRLVFGLLAQTAIRLGAGILPLFSHHHIHYFRTYAQVKVGNRYSIETQEKIGYIVHCFRCGFRSVKNRSELIANGKFAKKIRLAEPLLNQLLCPDCSDNGPARLKTGGPLWIGNIQSLEFVRNCSEALNLSLFSREELDLPLYYDLSVISSGLNQRTPKISDVMDDLSSNGFKVSRTRLNPKALRTDAPLGFLRSAVEKLAR